MKTHTTNYSNTFIEIADDCPVKKAEIPQMKEDNPTIASLQFKMIIDNPYKFTSDDVLFEVYCKRNSLPKREYKEARQQFFSKGQPCFRASPLTKRYGWGVHSNSEGKIAIYAYETKEYKELVKNKKLKIVKAMRAKRE